MIPYVSFLAPTYKTYICNQCGGIFYDLVDSARLEEIKGSMIQNARKKLTDKDIIRALEDGTGL